MVYILSTERSGSKSKVYSYQIVKNTDGTQMILGEGSNFDAPTSVLQYFERMKKALMEGKVFYQRDRATASYKYIIYEDPNNENSILDEMEGWQSDEEVRTHVQLMKEAILEGSKVIF